MIFHSRMVIMMNYFSEARRYLSSSNCLRRKYSCVIVNPVGHMISVGFNHSKIPCQVCARKNIPHNTGDYGECHSIHAEQMALLTAGMSSNLNSLKGCKLYLVCDSDEHPEPCPICARMMEFCGVYLVKE